MNELLDGKDVVMVGPSQSLIGSDMGPTIDEFDTVVRLNKSVPLNKALASDIGSRTDILYHCLDEPKKSKVNVDDYLEDRVKYVVSSYPKLSYTVPNINYFTRINKDRIPFMVTDLGVFNEIQDEIGTRPNTGLLALVDLLGYDINKLYITGFCFYKYLYYDGYSDMPEIQHKRALESPAHDHKKQMQYWVKLYKEDKRIILDKVLKDIFNSEGLL